ncbi:MAG: chemotaxis protein CheX [Tepidisphaeraceae bacterium]
MSTATAPATPTPAGPTGAINPKLIVPFVNSVRNVFSTMVKVRTEVERPIVKGCPAPSYDVSSIIGFSGDVIGSCVVSFQLSAAAKLVSAFAGMEIDPASPDFADAIGELANMIAGGAKKDLGVAASISTPSVVMGHGHTIARLRDVPCLVVPCRTEVGDFAVEISIKQVR